MHEVAKWASPVDRVRWGVAMVPHARAVVVPVLLVSAIAVCGCATAPRRLPHGGNELSQSPEIDNFSRAFGDAQMPCLSTPTLTARARVRGTVERRRIDSLLWVGVDVSGDAGIGRVRLEAADHDPSHFSLLATYAFGSDRKDEATLVLPGGRQVVRFRTRELVELVLGAPLSALDLLNVFSGCPLGRGGGELRFERFDANTMKMITTGETVVEVFMRRPGSGSPWTVFATVASMPGRPIRWRADAGERSGGVLESVRLTSLEWNGEAGRRFDVMFSLDHVQTPAPSAEMFTVPLPESAEFVAIDAVRLNRLRPLLAD
jgi:hypothetical protein